MKFSMYSDAEYNILKERYGAFASWAIWNKEDLHDTEVIPRSIKELNSNYVLLGLNKSIDIDLNYWKNFHGYDHARKLAYACNNTELRGSYMTDLFKNLPEAVASKLDKRLTDTNIRQNVETFRKEMEDIRLSKSSRFIVFGRTAEKYFIKYFRKYFDQPYICTRHYSDFRISDEMWVKEFLGNIRK